MPIAFLTCNTDTMPADESLAGILAMAAGLIAIGVAALRFAWHFIRPWFPPRPVPGARLEITLAFEVALVFVVASSLAFLSFGPKPEQQSIARALLVMLTANTFTIIYIGLVLRARGGRLADLGIAPANFKRGLGYAAILYLAFLPIVGGTQVALEALSQAIFGHTLAQQRVVVELGANAGLRHNIPLLLAIALIVPFCEEFLFRGFLYTVLRRHLSATLAIAIDAVIFGLVHDAGISAVILLGGLLAFLFERTGSLWACTLAHSLHNTSTVLLILFQGGSA
ncbi:MAG: type II CAAX endopeptidase family protein [Planctomycetota bacterium]